MTGDEREAPEVQVARIFQLAGYEVSQAVGVEPGTVDWFATPREGFVRPKTYFVAWKTCPERLGEALAELEQARVAKGADRALAVILEGPSPKEHRERAGASPTTVIGQRRLALELSGVVEQVRKLVSAGERTAMFSLRRRGIARVGEIDDVAEYLEAWIRTNAFGSFILAGPPFSGQSNVISDVVYRHGQRFLDDPEQTVALLKPFTRMELFGELVSRGWIAPIFSGDDLAKPAATLFLPTSQPTPIFIVESNSSEPTAFDATASERVLLEAPTPLEIDEWIRARAGDGEVVRAFLEARRANPDFENLSNSVSNLALLFFSAQRTKMGKAGLVPWIVAVVQGYMNAIVSQAKSPGAVAFLTAFEDASLEQFGLGRARSLTELPEKSAWVRIAAPASTWVIEPDSEEDWDISNARPWDEPLIGNGLILHYFLARKISREVRAGNYDVLVRYQFPREYVLLFLSILAPDVASRVAADRSEELRAQVESEVERRLQSTLAHMLKRSSGAARSHLKAIQRHIERTTPGAMSYELGRMDEELEYQSALAEQTRLWHEVPEGSVEGLPLRPYVEAAVKPLAETYDRVTCSVDVDEGLTVRASRDWLTEVLHCLLENAFHAVVFMEGLVAPSVRVEARLDGDVIRLDVLDNGPGVAPDDRPRIFRPYETTKKGGNNKPLGTGMGLPIARRYAEHMGAQVDIDPVKEQTCFFVRFVAWKEIG